MRFREIFEDFATIFGKQEPTTKGIKWYTYTSPKALKSGDLVIRNGTVFVLVQKTNKFKLYSPNAQNKIFNISNEQAAKFISRSVPLTGPKPFSLPIMKPPKIAPTMTGDIYYAIGDIHGMYDKLKEMIVKIKEDAKNHPGIIKHLVFLGDYINRGPESKQVIEFLRQKPGLSEFDVHCLKGNHEQMTLKILTPPLNANNVYRWTNSAGGNATLESYGWYGWSEKPSIKEVTKKIQSLGNFMASNELFRKHLSWMAILPTSYVTPEHIFVHAGIKPGVALDKQQDQHLLWIRNGFLDHPDPHPGNRTVIHGHTREKDPKITSNRIGIDTSAYAGGQLTCVVLENGHPNKFIRV